MVSAYARIAWRNVRRNRRRTVLTVTAVAFGVFLIIVKGGQRNGQYEQMIDTSVRRSTGHVQIHRAGFWDERSLKLAFPVADADIAAVGNAPHVEHVSVRLEAEALVGSGGENSTGARIVGVLPSAEEAMTVFSRNVMIDGAFPTDSDTAGAVIGDAMARNLGVAVGDELVLFAQARDGSIGAALLSLRGIYRVGEPELDGYTVVAHLARLQEMLEADGNCTAIALTVSDHRYVSEAMEALERTFPDRDTWEIMSYEELMPELMQTIALDWAVDMILQALLLSVVTFGILNTILMSVTERFHEFGVLMAIGMRSRAIGTMVFLEGVAISAMGLLVGNVLGYAVNDWWQGNPIVVGGSMAAIEGYGFVPMLFAVPDVAQQIQWSVVVLALTLLVSTWPATVAMRYRPIEAIRHV